MKYPAGFYYIQIEDGSPQNVYLSSNEASACIKAAELSDGRITVVSEATYLASNESIKSTIY